MDLRTWLLKYELPTGTMTQQTWDAEMKKFLEALAKFRSSQTVKE